jgi:hypothetical protein
MGEGRGGGTDPEEIARTLVDAVLEGDEVAAKKHKLSTRSVWRYRARSRKDSRLAELVRAKLELKEKDWAQDLPGAIGAAIEFLRRASEDADHKDPQVIYSIAGALKILTDVTMSRRVLDARLAPKQPEQLPQYAGVSGADEPAGEAAGEEPTAEEDKLGLQ